MMMLKTIAFVSVLGLAARHYPPRGTGFITSAPCA
jgi:hypothetical protein